MSKNDITGDSLVTRSSTDAYRDGWDRIFKKPVVTSEEIVPDKSSLEYNDSSSSTGEPQCPETTVKAFSQ